MAERLAIIAGRGALPLIISAAVRDALFVTMQEVEGVTPPKGAHLAVGFTQFGALFEGLRSHGITKVIFAGSMSRPKLDSAEFDEKTQEVMPTLLASMAKGDDQLLRACIAVFEHEGFEIVGVRDVVPELIAGPQHAHGPKMQDLQPADATRGLEVLSAISPLDLAQAIVVESGQVLGLETLQGTDAMLEFVSQTPAALRRGRGVFVKAAKHGQDMRVDMPAIGPDTIKRVARAGLAGLVIAKGQVLILEQDKVKQALDQTQLFLEVR